MAMRDGRKESPFDLSVLYHYCGPTRKPMKKGKGACPRVCERLRQAYQVRKDAGRRRVQSWLGMDVGVEVA
jgi:hypothetical protein